MPKSTKKKKVKKEKVSRKKKIKEISKDKLKKFEKELKEKEPEVLENPKGESRRIQEEHLINLEEFLINVRAPVLERVAIAEEIPVTTRTQQNRDRETGTQEETNYASASSDYADITTPNQETTESNPQYTEAINTFRNSQIDKAHKETRNLFGRRDYDATGKTQGNNFEKSILPEIEGADETRRYFTNKDKNS